MRFRRSRSPSNRLIVQIVELRHSRHPAFCVDAVGKMGKALASRADQSKHPDEPLRLKEI
jgi:hypothetical protein